MFLLKGFDSDSKYSEARIKEWDLESHFAAEKPGTVSKYGIYEELKCSNLMLYTWFSNYQPTKLRLMKQFCSFLKACLKCYTIFSLLGVSKCVVFVWACACFQYIYVYSVHFISALTKQTNSR